MPDVIDEHRSEIEGLCQRFGVARLDVFGSALGETFDLETSASSHESRRRGSSCLHADSPAVLCDALHAGRLVQRFVGGTTFDAYDTDDLMRSAVERQLEIVGEALNELAKVDPATASVIAELPRLVGFRNVLVHGYATVDDRLVRRIVEDHLPALLARLEELLPSENRR